MIIYLFRFVRTFSSSTTAVTNIKVEPSNYLDVDLGVNHDEINTNVNHEGTKYFLWLLLFLIENISVNFIRFETFSSYHFADYFEDGQDQDNINTENGDDNEAIFKVPSLPPDNSGNGVKKKKLNKKGNRSGHN